jgi:UDP-glucuronate 4-epimerase
MAYFSFAEKILAREPINIYNHGNLSRDFTYIDDIVESVVRIIGLSTLHSPLSTDGTIYRAPDDGARVMNIGNGAPVSLLEFVETLESELGVSATKNFVDMQPGDVEKTWADCQDLWELTGFRPSTSLKDGLHRFVEWYRGYYSTP